MATSAGLEAAIGMANEVTYGTFVTPARAYEFISETLKLNITRIESMGIRQGRRMKHRWKAGTKSVTGDVVMELTAADFVLIAEQIFGDADTTGSDPYTHLFEGLGTVDDRSLSVQVARPDDSATLRAFSYTGMKVTQWKIEAAIDEFVKSTVSFWGRNEVTSESMGTFTYDTEIDPFTFVHGNLTIGGTEVPVKSCDMTVDLSLAVDRHRMGTSHGQLAKIPKVNDLANISGSITADFENLTQYNRFVSGTEAALVLTFNGGADRQLEITSNVRFDGETPNVGGRELLELSIPYVVTSATDDATAFTMELVSSDAS